MAQQTRRPDLSGDTLKPGDWSGDNSQGVDYELIFDDTYQYCFIEMEQEPVELDFMAFGRMGERKVRSHPELHSRATPTEVVAWMSERSYAHLEHDVDTCRRFTVTGIADSRGDADDDLTVFETEGDIGSREQLTAAELVRALAIERVTPVEDETEAADEGNEQ